MSIFNVTRLACKRIVPLMLMASSGFVGNLQAECESEWSDLFAVAGDTLTIYDATVWDDGTGPALYAVGNFRQIGNSAFHTFSTAAAPLPSYSPQFIAKWNASSTRWEAVGEPAEPGDLLTNFQRINCIGTFDADGPGGASPSVLVVGGRNTAAGSGVAVWNGSTWSTLGTGLPGSRALEVLALAEYDADGNGPNPPELYAGGSFRATTATGTAAKYAIARWNGSSWQDVAGSLKKSGTPTCVSLAVYNGELYVAGDFTQAGDALVAAPGFAKWNGAAWSAVPGVLSSVSAQFVSNTAVMVKTIDMGEGPSLLVSGVRYTGLTNNVALAQLKDGVWSTLLERGLVYAAAMYDGALHIGGNALGPVSAWSNDPVDLSVDLGATKLFRKTLDGWDNLGFIGKYDDTVYAGGLVRALTVTDWDGAAPQDEKLFVGGQFAHVDDQLLWNMFLWNGNEAEPILSGSDALGFRGSYTTSGGANGATIYFVKEMDIDGSGPEPTNLIIAGEFESAGTQIANRIVSFNGSEYTQIGQQLASLGSLSIGVRDVLYFNDGANSRLFACKPDGVSSLDPLTNVWQYTGGSEGLAATRLLQFPINGQDRVVAFGSGCVSVSYYDGSAWQPLSQGIPQPSEIGGCAVDIFDAVIWDDGTGATMYASVRVSRPTTETWSATHLIRWNTTTQQWDIWGDSTIITPTFDTPEQACTDLAVHNGMLYVAGSFTSINGVAGTATLARRNGSAWESVADPFNPGTGGAISVVAGPITASPRDVIAWHDFGNGPELVVRGKFSDSSGTLGGAGRWNGSSWTLIPGMTEPTDTGYPSGSIFNIASGKSYDGLYFTGIAGLYRTDPAQVIIADGLARLDTVCTNPPCTADFNHVNGVTVQDIFDFLTAWLAGAPSADFNHVNGVTVQDIFDFLTAWLAGC